MARGFKRPRYYGFQPDEADQLLEAANVVLHGYGVEAIRGMAEVPRGYYHDIVALYVNMGEMYDNTILYETVAERFLVTTAGDWIEANEEYHDIR